MPVTNAKKRMQGPRKPPQRMYDINLKEAKARDCGTVTADLSVSHKGNKCGLVQLVFTAFGRSEGMRYWW